MDDIGQLEALLFAAGDEGIQLEELSFLMGQSEPQIYQLVQTLNEKYQEDIQSSLSVLELGNHFILATKKKYAPILKKYAKSPIANRLSQAALETLAIIAYKQPITRMEVDDIRGVQSSGSVQKLTTNRLIEEKGRVEGPGRAILYGTTEYFMDYFGLKSMQELPDIQAMEEELSTDIPFDLYADRYEETREEKGEN